MALSSMFNYAVGKAKGHNASFAPLLDRSPCGISGAAVHKAVKPASAAEKVITAAQIAAIARHMPEAEQPSRRCGWVAGPRQDHPGQGPRTV